MGLKKFKEHFGINHIVQIKKKENRLCIGSDYISDLISVNIKNGCSVQAKEWISPGSDIHSVLEAVRDAGPEVIFELLSEEDQFSQSLPVYTWDGAEIIERRCEEYGYPNVTHCGELMYENTYFKDRKDALAAAQSYVRGSLSTSEEQVAHHENELNRAKQRRQQRRVIARDLGFYKDIDIESMVPGVRYFICQDCKHEWVLPTDDCHSPSRAECPECYSRVVPDHFTVSAE